MSSNAVLRLGVEASIEDAKGASLYVSAAPSLEAFKTQLDEMNAQLAELEDQKKNIRGLSAALDFVGGIFGSSKSETLQHERDVLQTQLDAAVERFDQLVLTLRDAMQKLEAQLEALKEKSGGPQAKSLVDSALEASSTRESAPADHDLRANVRKMRELRRALVDMKRQLGTIEVSVATSQTPIRDEVHHAFSNRRAAPPASGIPSTDLP